MKKLILLIAIAFLISNTIKAQGCSDAGFCSVGNGHNGLANITNKHLLELGAIVGAGDFDVKYFSPYLSYTNKVNANFSLGAKITYSNARGSFGSIGALGDAFITGNYKFKTTKNNKHLNLLAGFKIPLNSGNLKINNVALPLDYQSSLATFDAIIGLNYNHNKWDFNTALQIPIINNNKNSYLKDFSSNKNFPSTNLFSRKADALFRTTYTLTTNSKKITFKPNVLFIYHLGDDSYENIFSKQTRIEGSQGLTINGNLITNYAINTKNSIEISLAAPFLVREIRPDGLTRQFTAGVIYKFSF